MIIINLYPWGKKLQTIRTMERIKDPPSKKKIFWSCMPFSIVGHLELFFIATVDIPIVRLTFSHRLATGKCFLVYLKLHMKFFQH